MPIEGPALGLAGFLAVLILILLRVPVAVAMGGVGALGYGLANGFSTLGLILGKSLFETISPVSLSVVPLFILMGVFAGHGGVSFSLYNLMLSFVGHLRGGLAMATIGASALFGAVSGSSIATTATIGKIAMPEMRRLGYDDRLASASVAAGGTLAVMIPPSILLVVYGLMTENSIGQLFIAGVLPGILGAALYMAAVSWMTWRNPKLGPRSARVGWRPRVAALRDVWQVVLLFGVVLGGMYAGFFAPTEAAAVGAFGAILLAAVTGRLTLPALRRGFAETASTSAMIFMILVGAAIFNYFIDTTGLTNSLIAAVEAARLDRWTVFVLLCVFYIVLGCFMDSLSMILLTIGAVYPLVRALGFDPIWFGVILVTLGEIGLITPPIGINLFILTATVPNLSMQTVCRGITPFVLADTVRIAVLTLVPALALWLPSYMKY
jgi:tripartite ATP-independent transporter DctM subunit